MIVTKFSNKRTSFPTNGCCLLLLIATVSVWITELKADSNYYRAAVLEHVRFVNTSCTPREIVEKNLEEYKVAAETAALNGADIIVFPEWGLYPHMKENRSFLYDFVEDVPDPKKVATNPCNEEEVFHSRPTLIKLSCLAKDNRIFVVANVADVKKCEVVNSCDANSIDECNLKNDCPDDGNYFFNTNVVFNREGTLVSRYYKRHLFFEFDMNLPIYPEDAYFETDFGRFTTVICFDLVFQESVSAVEKSGVVNLAYPTYWFDHTPFIYFATPNQQAWAFTNRVNLLAANVQYPGTGTLGSGIYSAHTGALIYTHTPDGRSKLLISNVPKSVDDDVINSIPLDAKKFYIKKGEAVEIDTEEDGNFQKDCLMNVLEKPNDNMSEYRCNPGQLDNYDFVKLEGNEGNLEICSNNFCCSLSYKADNITENYFFGVSGKPLVFYDIFTYGMEGCFLSRCESYDGHACTNYVLKSNTIFQTVELVGNFSTNYVFPFAVDSDVRLTHRDSWSFDGLSKMTYRNSKGSFLLFLGLYGRIYDLDKTSFK